MQGERMAEEVMKIFGKPHPCEWNERIECDCHGKSGENSLIIRHCPQNVLVLPFWNVNYSMSKFRFCIWSEAAL